MSDDAAKAKLLAILQSRGIPLGIDDVQWAFESGTTKAETVAWIEEYLNDGTLLTRDELDLYNAIGDSTKLELSTTSHDVVPMQDRDLKEAIAALKSSTSAIENHAKVLKAQREMLLKLQHGNGEKNGSTAMSGKHAQERSSLSFSIEDISFTVSEQLKEAEEQTSKALAALKSSSNERLTADGQVLEALSGISSKVSAVVGPTHTTSELEKWFQALAALRAGEVRAKIDALLATAGPEGIEEVNGEGVELQTELQTLKDEIDSVVHMVIGHELRNPLMKSLEESDKGVRQNQRGWSKYLLSTLEYLVAQLDGTIVRVIDLRNYTDALIAIRASLTAVEDESKVKEEITNTNRPLLETRQSSQSAPQSPSSMVPAALRRLNIRTPSTTPSDDLEQLSKLSLESQIKLQSQYRFTEKAIINTLSKSLAPRQQSSLAILQQLYASSNFGTIHLSDEGSEGKIRDLGKKIDELAPKVATGDLR